MRPIALLPLLLIGAVSALAEPPATRARALLTLADSSVDLRSRLSAYADSAAAGDHAGASEALGYAGVSFQREGRVDSAIVCHRRAYGLLDADEHLFNLVDQLLLRRGKGDAEEAIELLGAALARSERAAPPPIIGRIAWARFQRGEADSAAALFALVESSLLPHSEWRYRMACVALARQEYRRTGDLLLPSAVRTRGTDEEVIRMLEQAAQEMGVVRRIKSEVSRQIEDRDRVAKALADALGGRLLGITASDGFALGGLLVPAADTPPRRTAARRRPALLAVVLMAPGDTLASGDSLAVALRRRGITTLLLYPRGHGASVGPSCPSPDAWFDREAALQARVARDVRDAVRAVSRITPVDTARYLVAGVDASATMAVEAATLDPRVKALLLVSPAPAPVDRGLVRARLARLRLPVFFQIAPDDYQTTYGITDALYQAGNRSASRVVESKKPGQGLAQFWYDPGLAARFLAWLDATLQPAAAPRPTRPAPHRPG